MTEAEIDALVEHFARVLEEQGLPVDRAQLRRQLPAIHAEQQKWFRRLRPVGWLLDLLSPLR